MYLSLYNLLNIFRLILLLVLILSLIKMITKEDIINIQKDWSNALIDIGKLKNNWQECKSFAILKIEELYFLDKVLFKPTMAKEISFRHTKEGILSYFIGNNKNFKEDNGFALNVWQKIRFENSKIILEEETALAMGHYFFSSEEIRENKVEYSFVYRKTRDGKLKIQLHHSSLPFQK